MGQTMIPSFVRHRGPVTCVAGIPNSTAVVSSAYDGGIGWFDLATHEAELLGYHEHLANRITVNATGTLAASSSSDYSIYIWDLERKTRRTVLLGHADDVEDFAFADDSTGVSVSRDCRVIVWNLDTGAIRRVIEGHERDALAVIVADGRIYTSGDDMTLRVWDLDTGRLIRMWGPFENETDSCAIDTLNGRAILGCDDGVIRIFDIASGETLGEIPAHSSGIKKVAASPITGDILSAAYDQKIHIWDAKTFAKKLSLEQRFGTWERSFNWTPDGDRVVAGTFDGTVLLWDAATGKCLDEIGDKETGNVCLNEVSANATGDLATVSDDGFVRLGRLTVEESSWTACVEPRSGRVLANAITIDDAHKLAVSGAHNHRVHLFDWEGGELRNEIAVPLGQGPINSIRVAHHPGYDGDIFVGCYSGAVVRLDRDGSIKHEFEAHDGAVKALRLHPEQTLGVSCSANYSLHSWDFEGNVVRRFPGHMAIVDDVDIDPRGERIASVSRDFTVKVWDLASGTLLHSFSLGKRSPKGVLFYDPNTVIVTNYWGGLFRFELDTGRKLVRQIAENGISSISHGIPGHVIASSYDGGAYLVRAEDLRVVNVLRGMWQRPRPEGVV